MTTKIFRKTLSANDVGATGGHQAGILIPKGETELLEILPQLNPQIKNPDAWISCVDQDNDTHTFRFVYYNNKLHEPNGTRNEYRITHMTGWLRNQGAKTEDAFEICGANNDDTYQIRIVSHNENAPSADPNQPVRIRLKGWRRIH